MLASILGMLLGVCRVLFALGVVAFLMMLGGGAVGFRGIFVMFSCFIVLVSGHWASPAKFRGTKEQPHMSALVPRLNEIPTGNRWPGFPRARLPVA